MKLKKFLILAVILFFPSAIYILLTAGKERSFVRLPYFGPKRIVNVMQKGKMTADTAFYRIPDFSLTDCNGDSFTAKALAGRVWVACFIRQNDKAISPSISVLMNRIEERTNLDTSLRLVTLFLDSAGAKELAGYKHIVHAGDRQIFLGGNTGAVKNLAVDGFYQPVDTPSADFAHFFLVDRQGSIRGIYNALRIKEADRLVDEISMLEAAYYIQNEKKKDKEND